MAKDFRATQIETSKIILSGGLGQNGLGGIIYSGSVSSDREGGIPITMLDNVGSDVELFISGTIDGRGVPAPNGDSGIALFGGDLVVSGALHTEHSVHRKITIHSSNFNVNSGMHYMHITPSTHVTASLQTAAAAGEGRILTFVDSSGLAAPGQRIVIEPNGAETISGASSAIIETAYGSITIQSDGVNKYLIVGTN